MHCGSLDGLRWFELLRRPLAARPVLGHEIDPVFGVLEKGWFCCRLLCAGNGLLVDTEHGLISRNKIYRVCATHCAMVSVPLTRKVGLQETFFGKIRRNLFACDLGQVAD